MNWTQLLAPTCKEKISPLLLSSHSSPGIKAFHQGPLPDHEPQTTAYHTTVLSSEPSPNINLWNHKAIMKLCSIFPLKTPYWRTSLNWNQAYIFLRTTEPGLENVFWTLSWTEPVFHGLGPRVKTQFFKRNFISAEAAFNPILAPHFGKSSIRISWTMPLRQPFIWRYPRFLPQTPY